MTETRTAEVHLVSHTHWDREWYLTREQFRLRLVDLVDRAIELLDRDPAYAFFHLDGQTIVLEDYLEVRPERRGDLERLIRAGRLLVGPWYVMPDEFLVSGEALVRNLATGHAIARGFGRSMPVGYLPDLFGHVAQMPQILRRFGLDNAILWRGFGGRGVEYWWEAPDGTRVLMLHLPREGYCNATRVVLSPAESLARAERAIAHELERSRTGVALLMNGVDHVEPHPAIPGLVEALRARGCRASHSTLPAYVEAVRRALAADPHELEVVKGELRAGEDYAPLLPGVLSARVYLKQANARVQRELERWAEPLAAMAWMLGEPYPAGVLQYAWKTLLQNHPHDSICGCSIDAVHEENVTRFARAQQVADALTARAAAALVRRLGAADLSASASPRVSAPSASSAPRSDRLRTVLLNTSGISHSGVVDLTLDLPYDSAEPGRVVDPEALDAPVTFWPLGSRPVEAEGADGRALAFQIVDEQDAIAFVMSRLETPWALRVRRFHVVVETGEVPGVGSAGLDWTIAQAPAAGATVDRSDRRAANGRLELVVNADGTVDVTDLQTGVVHRRCGECVDEGDAGDEYTYSPPASDLRVTSADARSVRVERIVDGPLRTVFRIASTLPVPACVTADRSRRSEDRVDLEVTSLVTLDAGEPFVRWQTTVNNTARDHRLRLVFPAGSLAPGAGHAVADSAFALQRRPARREAAPSGDPVVERPVSYAPMQSLVTVGQGPDAVTIVADGLMEYEVEPGPAGARVGITLLRCVDALSREGLAMRPYGHAGPGLETPGAQCLGTRRFDLTFAPGRDGSQPVELFRLASRVLAPPRASTAAPNTGTWPGNFSLLRLEGDVVLSACKKADSRDGVVVRYFNPSDAAAAIRLGTHRPVREAWLLNLLEEREQALTMSDGEVRRVVAPHAIETIELVL